MAQTKITKPGQNAFKGGALDSKWLGELVDVVNTPMEIKGGGKVIYSKEKIVFDLSEVTQGVQCYVVNNGELRLAVVQMKFIG
jgi:hypothetical protein